MTDLLFNLTIGPLQFIYEIVYSGLFGLTHNYGWSLILLSFVTTFITVPLGQAVSVHIKKERLIESILDPQIKKIKSTSTGAEQSRRIRNLYKRYAYNPLYSIRLAFGVLIQLPFLIGAYWMIAEHPALNGVSFGPIADLSTPDQLLWGINLLPLIMTIANLGVVVVSMQMPKRDRIQAVIVAGLFLILLYSAPSALLVYWTTNNVLLLIRTLAIRILDHFPTITFFDAYKLTFCSFLSVHKSVVLYAAAILVSLLTLQSLGIHGRTLSVIKALSDTLFLLAFVHLTCRFFFNRKNWSSDGSFKWICLCLLTLFISIRIFGYWIFNVDRLKLTTQAAILFPVAFAFSNDYVFGKIFKNVSLKQYKGLFAPAYVLICTLILFYFPLNVYLSDPAVFGEDFKAILLMLSKMTIGSILIGLWAWLLIGKFKSVSNLLLVLICVIGLLCLVYGFVVVPEYSAINEFKFHNTNFLRNKKNYLIDALVLLSIVAILLSLMKANRLYWLRNLFLTFTLVVVGLSSFKIFEFFNIQNNINQNRMNRPFDNEQVEKQLNDFFSFSKNGKNIVVIMLDTFSGGNIKEIASQHPDLIKRFTGFVWYSDHMATGNSTMQGKPALLGGPKMTPIELSKDRTKSLEEKINVGWANTLKILQHNGFRISIFDNTWLDPAILNTHLLKPAIIYDRKNFSRYFKNLWLENEHFDDKTFSTNRFLYAFGLFSTVPLSFKKVIYQDGQWLKSVKIQDNGYKSNLDWWTQLINLDKVSVTKDDKKNSFIFIVNEITHHPWLMSPECKPQKKKEDWSRNDSGIMKTNLQNEICALKALANWFDWMKRNSVYDNSRIILVSDHDGWNSSQLWELLKKGEYPIERPNSLFLIKDFEVNTPFSTNDKVFTSSVDIPAFILQGYNLQSSQPWNNSNRLRCLSLTDWQRSHQGREYYNIYYNLCVRGSLFKKENWYKTAPYNLNDIKPYEPN